VKPSDPRYVCGACGRQSLTREPGDGSEDGWDESCMLKAVWCRPTTSEDGLDPDILWYALEEPKES